MQCTLKEKKANERLKFHSSFFSVLCIVNSVKINNRNTKKAAVICTA